MYPASQIRTYLLCHDEVIDAVKASCRLRGVPYKETRNPHGYYVKAGKYLLFRNKETMLTWPLHTLGFPVRRLTELKPDGFFRYLVYEVLHNE